jgi:hypothetical protein
MTGYEYRTLAPTRVFDIIDDFARQRGLAGARPRPIGDVRVFLIADHTPGANRVFPVPPEFMLVVNGLGYAISFGRLRQADGAERAVAFGGGPYLLRVRSDYYQVSDFDNVQLPATQAQPEPYEMVLEAGYTYPFPAASTPPTPQIGNPVTNALALLRGAVLAPDGSGVADAVVTAPAAIQYRTDTDGQWVLVFADGAPASGLVDVTVTAPGAGPVTVPGVTVTPAGEADLLQTGLRGRLLAPGTDPATAVVEVAGQPGQAGVRSDGVWAYYFPLTQAATTVTVTATLLGRGTRTVPGVPVTPRSTTAVPDFSFPRP